MTLTTQELAAAVEATSDSDTALSVRQVVEEGTVRTVDLVITGVDLTLRMSLDTAKVAQDIHAQMLLVDECRKVFGEHILLEQLKLSLGGTVEAITVSRSAPLPPEHRGTSLAELATRPAPPPPPPQPHVPGLAELGTYKVVADCPWRGYSLSAIDPVQMERVLNDATKVTMLHPQDIKYMGAYLTEKMRSIQAVQQSMPMAHGVPFNEDEIPF